MIVTTLQALENNTNELNIYPCMFMLDYEIYKSIIETIATYTKSKNTRSVLKPIDTVN